jgi:hypothetical protein
MAMILLQIKVEAQTPMPSQKFHRFRRPFWHRPLVFKVLELAWETLHVPAMVARFGEVLATTFVPDTADQAQRRVASEAPQQQQVPSVMLLQG